MVCRPIKGVTHCLDLGANQSKASLGLSTTVKPLYFAALIFRDSPILEFRGH